MGTVGKYGRLESLLAASILIVLKPVKPVLKIAAFMRWILSMAMMQVLASMKYPNTPADVTFH